MHTHNGNPLPKGEAFTIGNKQYPANWLALASPADLVAAGVTYTADPAPTLDDVKAAKLASLAQDRKVAAETLPNVTVAGKQYPATAEYREVITGIARRRAAGRPTPTTLRGADGVSGNVNDVLLAQIDDAIAAAVQAVWDRYWSRFDAINAATTAAEVDAIVW